MTDNELRALAEQIRAELPVLVADADERERLDRDLGQALEQPAGTAAAALRQVLQSHPAVRDWVETDNDRSITTLPGDSTSQLGVLFVCPNRDYSTVREVVTSEVLVCPHDGAALERYDG
ncbi:hypothetical protein StrepF001_42225 [Streptomyces sp. F001]|uniref:hypothetical protein n=1 Tax=Streptomyces sp. F001 TaxID=1510026 RepID=UPI00101E2343|nr:hypothetical protein [Streptomyces sp. F001]RZB13795.1 hypothetical protein StrepF001_42225 [Streptomyces sp. F001]